MAVDFSKFDEAVNMDQLQKDIKEAKDNGYGDFGSLPKGEYIVGLENMEIGATKDGRPMFKVQCRVIEALDSEGQEYLTHFKNKKPCMFMNRVIYGTKNDGNMINRVIGWLNKLEVDAEFNSYSQFNDLVLDIAEEVVGAVELKVAYDEKAFNSISILEVYDV
jgi:hypothetical protein